MFCSKCGNKSPEGARFCHKCGTKTAHDNNPAPNTANPNIQHTAIMQNPGMAGFHIPQNPAVPNQAGHMPMPGQQQPPMHINTGFQVPMAQSPNTQLMGYPAPPVDPSLIDYTNHQPYAISPVVPPEVAEYKADPTDYMDYDFFPTKPKSADSQDEVKDETADTQFVDYPLQPTAQKPEKPEPTKPAFADYTIHPNPTVTPYQPQPQPSNIPPHTEPVHAMVNPAAPSYPPQPWIQSHQPLADETDDIRLPWSGIALQEGLDSINYVDLPVQEPIHQNINPNSFQNQSYTDGFATNYLHPTGDSSNQAYSSPDASTAPMGGVFSDIMPAQFDSTTDTDNYFLDDTDISDILPPPDLLFMENTSSSKFTHADDNVHMNNENYAPSVAMPMDDFVQVQRYGSQAEEMHVQRGNKGKVIIVLGAVVIIALVAVFFIFFRGGISQDQLIGTWAPSGPGMGTWVHRLEFNQDGTGRRYHFDEQYFHVVNEDHFDWEITGRNRVERTRWIEGVPFHDTLILELSTRYGEPLLRYRVESETTWTDFRRVRVEEAAGLEGEY